MKSWLALVIVVVVMAFDQPKRIVAQSSSQQTARGQATSAVASLLPNGVTTKEARFYSEGIQCYGRIFLPPGFSNDANLAAVVLAPGAGETLGSIERYAARLASRGLIAMAIDYRGWGKSGGFLQTVDQVKTDDRLRFSQMTAKVRVQRKRVIPRHQILDIRNALYYLQGEPGVDRGRLGLWGTDLAGGHVIAIAAIDSRIKAVVAQVPLIDGKDKPRTASAPTGELLQAEQRRARTGHLATAVTGVARETALESRLALSEYHPFWLVDQIPEKTAVLFVIAEKDSKVNNEANAIAASKLLKGPNEVVTVPGTTHGQIDLGSAFEIAASAAAEWFLKHL